MRVFLSILVIWGLAGAEPVFAQELGGGASPSISFFRVFFALAIGIIVALLATLGLKRLSQRPSLPSWLSGFRLTSPNTLISVKEVRRLGLHGEICVIEVDGERIVLAQTAHTIEVLKREPIACETHGEAR
ncbi:flagellar biosynthetic protein FliO [Maricaulis sp. D1M11]|uniref:flagellar biosynthetic protein FliO n=1 Tax=Maricaulis sp. D1M11 TaxID=3076117 RepID=UPI0039B601A6